MSLEEQVKIEVVKLIEELDPEIFLVDVILHRGSQSVLSVLIDTDVGITIDRCVKLSRMLGAILEEHPGFGFAYRLEVSSPGITRPLKLLRQYRKNIGRELKVRTLEGQTFQGLLTKIEENSIVLEPKRKGKKKKKKKGAVEEEREVKIEFDTIKEAKVVISFA